MRILRLRPSINTLSQLKLGLWFDYRFDEVLYLWPWVRKNPLINPKNKEIKCKWYSLITRGRFPTLEDLDIFWEQYFLLSTQNEQKLNNISNRR